MVKRKESAPLVKESCMESVYNYFENELPQILHKLPLGGAEYIGIYGMGVHTERLLQRYRMDVGPIKAKIIFIDSNKQSYAEKYDGCDVYNVHDIGKLPLDAIILSSFLHEEEMFHMIKELYGNRFCIYRFYEEGQEDIFLRKKLYLGVRPGSLEVMKVNFVDFWPSFDIVGNFITEILAEQYKLEISEKPDVLFCSHFGDAYKKYNNCVKVFIATEVQPIDLSHYDYVIGYQYMNIPQFQHYNLYAPRNLLDSMQNRGRFSDSSLVQRKFCNFIYSNENWGEGAYLRKQFCLELSKYKHIDCPGKVLNNMKEVIMPRESKEWEKEKQKFMAAYKFTISFENHMAEGYTTEKLWGAFRVGSVPIYWGNPLIGKEVCKEAFINCNDFDNDFSAVIHRVKEVDSDDEYYMYMLGKAPLKESYDSGYGALSNFLKNYIKV